VSPAEKAAARKAVASVHTPVIAVSVDHVGDDRQPSTMPRATGSTSRPRIGSHGEVVIEAWCSCWSEYFLG
jgi:hypothetical protein